MSATKIQKTVNVRPKIEDDLSSQHQYVEAQKQRPDAFSLVAPDAFVRSIRDLGYKSTLTALDELVDNSVQANAQTVEVFLAYAPDNKSQKKPDYIVVFDDGHGMEPDMIRLAVKWGGTHREGDRSGFGRYGFGLPSACVSIGRQYTVYSKVPGGAWHAVRIDIDDVSQKVASGGKPEPVAQKKELPKFVTDHVNGAKLESGTVVVIESLDRIDSGFKTTQAFVRNMLEHIGVIYRKQIPQIKFLVDGVAVEPVDPLFLDENGRWFDETPVKAQVVPSIEFEVGDEQKGLRGWVRIRACWFPYNFHLKDPEGSLVTSNHNSRFKIMKSYNGIVVCRAGRQIDVVTHLPWDGFTFVNFDRFWKIEIDFDPALDEYFGITTHKQQIVLSDSMLDQLKTQGLPGLIKDLRRKMKVSRAQVRASLEQQVKKPRPSEEALNKTRTRKPRTKPSLKQVKKAEENLEQKAKERADITGETVAKEKERLEREIAERPYKVEFEAVTDGPIYRGERLGGQYRLIVNTSHRFYTDVYEPAGKLPGLRSKLEAWLFVAAEAELDAVSDEQEAFFKAARVHWSQRLTDVLTDIDASGEQEDEASAEMEEQEASAS